MTTDKKLAFVASSNNEAQAARDGELAHLQRSTPAANIAGVLRIGIADARDSAGAKSDQVATTMRGIALEIAL